MLGCLFFIDVLKDLIEFLFKDVEAVNDLLCCRLPIVQAYLILEIVLKVNFKPLERRTSQKSRAPQDFLLWDIKLIPVECHVQFDLHKEFCKLVPVAIEVLWYGYLDLPRLHSND